MSPVNHYFDHFTNKSEQDLYNDLINECVQTNGIMANYIPRDSESEVDLIFGDDPTKKFTDNYPVEVYIQTVDGFDGGDIFSKFGLQVNKQVRLLITQRAFEEAGLLSISNRPREGDLLWLSNFKTLFEIKFTEEEYFYYSFGTDKYYGYSLLCEFFRYNNEKMETNLEEVTEHINEVATVYEATMNVATGSSTYIEDETVYQGANAASSNASAVVVSWDAETGKLLLKHTKGNFSINTNIVGMVSGAIFEMDAIETLDNVNSELDNNLEIKDEAGDVLNFDENNPFGDIDV